MLRGLRVELNLNAECNNASKQPLGRYDFACVKRRAGAFTMWPGRFLKKMSDFLAPWGDTKKTRKNTDTSHTHTVTTASASAYTGHRGYRSGGARDCRWFAR